MSIRNKLFTILFVTYLLAIALMNIISSDSKFSEQENRYLQQKPKISLKHIISGKFMEDFEVYLSDQFAGKDVWRTIKAKAEQAMLKREANGIYIGSDGYLFERFLLNFDQFDRNIQLINEFAEKNKERTYYVLLAPTSIDLYKDKLPLYAPTDSQKGVLQHATDTFASQIKFINVYDQLMEHKGEPIYFQTDHHWTMRGAYYAYIEAAKEMDFTPITNFSIEIVSNDFLGTFASKVIGYPMQKDFIEVYQPKFDISYHVTYEYADIVSSSLFNDEYLEKKDKYSYFLNGNHSLVIIRSSTDSKRKLAVIKDSYAHAFVPFIANHFDEIHVLDLRYFHTDIEDYLDKNDLNEVLFLYNIANFSSDPNLFWLRR